MRRRRRFPSSWRSTRSTSRKRSGEVKQELTKHGVIPEEWGGENIFVNVSARTGRAWISCSRASAASGSPRAQGADRRLAAGYVMESSLEKGRGAVPPSSCCADAQASASLVDRQEFGRVRALFRWRRKAVESAGPSIRVWCSGFPEPPCGTSCWCREQAQEKSRPIARRNPAT